MPQYDRGYLSLKMEFQSFSISLGTTAHMSGLYNRLFPWFLLRIRVVFVNIWIHRWFWHPKSSYMGHARVTWNQWLSDLILVRGSPSILPTLQRPAHFWENRRFRRSRGRFQSNLVNFDPSLMYRKYQNCRFRTHMTQNTSHRDLRNSPKCP